MKLAKSKSYELVAVTAANLIFVDARYYPLFHIPDNSLDVMHDESLAGYIFHGYDGEVFLARADHVGDIPLSWHEGVMLRAENVQVLPKAIRKIPTVYTQREWFLYRWWRRIKHQ